MDRLAVMTILDLITSGEPDAAARIEQMSENGYTEEVKTALGIVREETANRTKERAKLTAWQVIRGEITLDERRKGVFSWRDDFEPEPALTVRCGEPVKSRGMCGEIMARVWTSPYGYLVGTRCPVSHLRTMVGLNLVIKAREEGNEPLARYAEAAVALPTIGEFFLGDWPMTKAIPAGCKRRHGNVLLEPQPLIVLTDSPRKSVNVRPSSMWEYGDDQPGAD